MARILTLLLLLAGLLAASCGVKGPPRPPEVARPSGVAAADGGVRAPGE